MTFSKELLNDMAYFDFLNDSFTLKALDNDLFFSAPNPLNFSDKFIHDLFDHKVEYVGKYINTVNSIKPISKPEVSVKLEDSQVKAKVKETEKSNIVYQSTIHDKTKIISSPTNEEVTEKFAMPVEEVIYEDYQTYFKNELFSQPTFFSRFSVMASPLLDFDAFYDKLGAFLIVLYCTLAFGLLYGLSFIPFVNEVMDIAKQNLAFHLFTLGSFYLASLMITVGILTLGSYLIKSKQ